MTASTPRVILRLGSHAEKEYIEKTLTQIDSVILGANLMEATPGATASLILKCSAQKRPVPVYVDPMTYAFGQYRDPETRVVRVDLDWIKSEQKVKGGNTQRRFKRSYGALAVQYGGMFEAALTRGVAVSPADVRDGKKRRAAVETVITYQLMRARREFEKDAEFRALADSISPPPAVFAPYFYVEPANANEWLDANIDLAREASERFGGTYQVHAVLCADNVFFDDAKFLDRLVTDLPRTGVMGVWLWMSRFVGDAAPLHHLLGFRQLVESLSGHLEVFDLHGGFFSLALSRVGMRGVSHGVGYGEQKDVMPVVGQSTPTVRYYVPPLRRRLGVLEIERSFKSLGIRTPADFFAQICNCAICTGVVKDDLRNFSQFGDMHYSRPQSRRKAQTPIAAKLCRYHFLLSRYAEREWMSGATLADIRTRLEEAEQRWGGLAPLGQGPADHLGRWRQALRD